jgi:LDH2 family malate/lactate/ureidoglycolate dehydrogenase
MDVDAGLLRDQIRTILEAWGMEPPTASITAELMAETDLRGIDSHGVSMLMMYEGMHRAGQLNLQARPRVVRESPCTALIDGDAGLGHPIAAQAMNLAVDKAAQCGVGMVGVRNSHHFGAAALYSGIAASRGMIGMVTSSTRVVAVVPTRAAIPVLGTNPIAFAAPTRRNRTFSLDMATSTTAVNKVKVYDLNDKPVPEGWVVDGAGKAVTDAAEAMAILMTRPEGGLTPLGGNETLGGHKGYGLGMMVHILAGALTGASFSPIRNRTQKPDEGDNIGHFCLAIDPKAFREEGEFERDLDDAIDVLRETTPVDPSRPVLIAGDPEAETRARRLENGVPIPPKLDEHIRNICARAGSPYLLKPKSAG